MRNVTLSIDDRLLELSREYARRRGTTLNSLVRSLLEKEVAPAGKTDWPEIFALMDQAQGRSESPWKRGDLYDL